MIPKSKPILCGSIAGSIGGTGVLMHNAAYRAAELPYTYVSFEPSDAKSAIQAVRALGIRGLGVTMPYKQEVMQYLDELDETAKVIGAVNTIVNTDGILKGYNTDWIGAIEGLKKVTELSGKKTALFGAGGVARAILYGLKKENADVEVYNILEDEGKNLCNTFQVPFMGDISNYSKEKKYDIIINATSVGFQSTETLLMTEDFPTDAVVLDVVFKPLITVFAEEALKAGCTVVRGYTMLILQAMAQDKLYTGVEPSFDVMASVLKSQI